MAGETVFSLLVALGTDDLGFISLVITTRLNLNGSCFLVKSYWRSHKNMLFFRQSWYLFVIICFEEWLTTKLHEGFKSMWCNVNWKKNAKSNIPKWWCLPHERLEACWHIQIYFLLNHMVKYCFQDIKSFTTFFDAILNKNINWSLSCKSHLIT